MSRASEMEAALRRGLAEADYICTGPIPHGDCWACAARAALALPSDPQGGGLQPRSPDGVKGYAEGYCAALEAAARVVEQGAIPSERGATLDNIAKRIRRLPSPSAAPTPEGKP